MRKCRVVPYVGTWIEILLETLLSLRMWRRSLRGNVDRNICRAWDIYNQRRVVPYVGTWIEILHGAKKEMRI